MKKWNLQNNSETIISNINITPLTDVMLVLLIIFMVTTPLIMMESFKIKLPEAESSGMETGKGITISITREGNIYVDDKKTEFDQLPDELTKIFSTEKDRTVILKADREVLHGMVVNVLDKAKKAGAAKISIATQPQE